MVVFLYNIFTQNNKDQVCKVRLYEGLDCQVAIATNSGTVIIACVPIDISSELPNKEKKQVIYKLYLLLISN